MENTVSRSIKNNSPVYIPALINGLGLVIAGFYYVFTYVAKPSTLTLTKNANIK